MTLFDRVNAQFSRIKTQIYRFADLLSESDERFYEIGKMLIEKSILVLFTGMVLGVLNYQYWQLKFESEQSSKYFDKKIESSSELIATISQFIDHCEKIILIKNSPDRSESQIQKLAADARALSAGISKYGAYVRVYFSPPVIDKFEHIRKALAPINPVDLENTKELQDLKSKALCLREELFDQLIELRKNIEDL